MAALVTVASIVVLAFPAGANTYPFFDWAWGYGYERQFHQNRWWVSDSVMVREQSYVRLQLDKCLPKNAKLKLGYISPSGWLHRVVTSPFGACDVKNLNPSAGPSHVAFRIQFWNCTEDLNLFENVCGLGSVPTTEQTQECIYNIVPSTGCPGGFKWWRIHEGWAYTNILGCGNETQCQMKRLGSRTARAE